MIYFNRTYIPAGEIKAIECTGSDREGYPYRIWIYAWDQKFGIDYMEREKRDAEAAAIARKVDAETSSGNYEDFCTHLGLIYTRLDQIERTVSRAEKRQLRIWQRLGKLFPLASDGEERQ